MNTKIKLTIVAALIAAITAPVLTANVAHAARKGAYASASVTTQSKAVSTAEQRLFDRAGAIGSIH